MLDDPTSLLSHLLSGTVAALDLPPALHALAEKQYVRVGEFLADQEEPAGSAWDIYAQGSILLGTVVRPLDGGDFDLDMVCRRNILKTSTTQEALKNEVGEALAKFMAATSGEPDAPYDCDESRRCWTLLFADPFHLDVLPAIPDPDASPTGILLTDRQLRFWQHSDPIAYARWFRGRFEVELQNKRVALARTLRASVESVPEWRVKTTLQQVVQVLKRHRDIHFADDHDDQPPSILVTTLAAHAYRGDEELIDAVSHVAASMGGFVEHSDGIWRVMNPVADENFADKWASHPQRAVKFSRWLDRVQADLGVVRSGGGLEKVAERLAESFGHAPVRKAVSELGTSVRATRAAGDLKLVAATGGLTSAAGVAVRPHQFYGAPEEA